MPGIVKTPDPPYYAVIFASERTEGEKGYGIMADKMVELASKQKGFLGIESARDQDLGITVSYWDSLESIRMWKENSAHRAAQHKGKKNGIKRFRLEWAKWKGIAFLRCRAYMVDCLKKGRSLYIFSYCRIYSRFYHFMFTRSTAKNDC